MIFENFNNGFVFKLIYMYIKIFDLKFSKWKILLILVVLSTIFTHVWGFIGYFYNSYSKETDY